MATYTNSYYDAQGSKIRASSEQPEWFSFTYQVPTTLTLATGDIIKFAKFAANQQVLQYAVGANGSIATGTGADGALAVGSTSIDTSVGNFGGNDSSIGEIIVVDHVSADNDDLKLTLGTLDTATTSGTRSITLRVLVANQEARASTPSTSISFPTWTTT
jgi:hypothetical protein